MSRIKLEGHENGTGTVTITAPNTNTDRAITIPDEGGAILTNGGALGVSDSAPNDSLNIDSSGNVGIGTSSPSTPLHISTSSNTVATFASTDTAARISITDGTDTGYVNVSSGIVSLGQTSGLSGNNLNINSSGNVGIGTTSPASELDIYHSTDPQINLTIAIHGTAGTILGDADGLKIYGKGDGNQMRFYSNTSEAMRIDSSGNLLVGKNTKDTYSNTVGHELQSNGMLAVTRDGNKPLILNRLTSDGDMIHLRYSGTTNGIIGVSSGVPYFAHSGGSGANFSGNSIYPSSNGGTNDDALDCGVSWSRWDDVYATNGTIQTSDQNEKQQIASLTDAEMNVAKRLSALFKTFKWNSSVEENGDNARTHSGIIAQDMQQAFTDEDLDASNYAMFISSTWWEKEISVDAVEEETDEEGNVITEGKDAYTYMDTKEEATEGYTERTRLGVRYPELFAFINAYNDQRFADLETRIETLENA